MAFCPKCGAEIADGTKFCTSCGAKIEETAQAQQQPQQQAQPQQQQAQQFQNAVNKAMGEGAPLFDAEEVNKGKVIAILMYIFQILFFLPLVSPDLKTEYTMHHANNALLLLILSVASGIVNVIPILGLLVSLVAGIFGFICFILGIISAVKGTKAELPLIGQIKILK